MSHDPKRGDAVIVVLRLSWLDRLRVLFHGRLSVRTETAEGPLTILGPSEVSIPSVLQWPWRRRGFVIEAPGVAVGAPRATLPGALLLVALALLAGQAGAQGMGSPIGGDPCGPGYDPDGGVELEHVDLPDGGPEDVPAAICQGQRAPAHGVFLTVDEAARRAGEREQLRHDNALLKEWLTKADAIPGWVWLLTCVASVGVSTYLAVHHH